MQPQYIGITINGEPKQVPGDQSVYELLQHLQIQADRVAVELNKSIVRKRDWEQTAITEGSYLEIVEFVGGG
jgi:sulfur carrier protein